MNENAKDWFIEGERIIYESSIPVSIIVTDKRIILCDEDDMQTIFISAIANILVTKSLEPIHNNRNDNAYFLDCSESYYNNSADNKLGIRISLINGINIGVIYDSRGLGELKKFYNKIISIWTGKAENRHLYAKK